MLLQQLSDARGISGCEREVREIIEAAIDGLVDEQRVDTLGNLICLRRARRPVEGRPLKVMVAAHMDEIGLIVTGVNKDGTVRFDKVGGIDDRILLSKQVLIGQAAVPGVIGYRPIHLIARKEREAAPDLSRAAIDIGATSQSAAERLVSLGDPITFRTTYEALEPGALRCVKGKALDDRAGCAVLVDYCSTTMPSTCMPCSLPKKRWACAAPAWRPMALSPISRLCSKGPSAMTCPRETRTPATSLRWVRAQPSPLWIAVSSPIVVLLICW